MPKDLQTKDIQATCEDKYMNLHIPGAIYSNLTMSLVNDSLTFQMAILQIHCYFLLKKNRESFALQKILTFFQQKITVYLLLKLI